MAKQETVSLRKHLDNLLLMKGAHLSFDEAIADFPAALPGAKPVGAPHSAWELLEHMRIAQEDILDFSRNPNYREKSFPDDYWPVTEAPPNDEAWTISVESFRSDLREMQALIAEPHTICWRGLLMERARHYYARHYWLPTTTPIT
jgi:hypothetical protein